MKKDAALRTEVWSSSRSTLTWKHRVTKSPRRLLFQLVPSTPRTEGTEFGLWPTATSADTFTGNLKSTQTKPGSKHSVTLSHAVQMWPTPVAHDDGKTPEAHMAMKRRMKGGPRKTITSLSVMVKGVERGLWPTPDAAAGGRTLHNVEIDGPTVYAPNGVKRQISLEQAAKMFPTPRAGDSKGGQYQYDQGNHKKPRPTLTGIAKMYPTPRASDGEKGIRLEAYDFCMRAQHQWGFEGVIFDPPYSFRQVSEHYKIIGKKATQKDTSMAFYEKVKSAICEKIKSGGYAISCGWNSNGFGKTRGFEIVEILIVAHGGSKNDTIVVVEKKYEK